MNDFFIWIESHPHTTTLITALISVLIAIGGWFVVAWRNRKLEVDKFRLSYRTEVLRNAIYGICALKRPLNNPLSDEEKKMIERVDIDIQSIGTNDEIEAWKSFFDVVKNTESSNDEIREYYIKLMSTLVKNMRKEYGVSNIEFKLLIVENLKI